MRDFTIFIINNKTYLTKIFYINILYSFMKTFSTVLHFPDNNFFIMKAD